MRSIILALAIASFSVNAQAGELVTYIVDGETFEGHRSPARGEAKGLVLIIHDWDGPDEYEMKRADMVAALGYDAFALDLYGKGVRPSEIADKKKQTGRLYEDRARMRKLILAGLEEARKRSAGKAVVMGYCFGGSAALELARSGAAKDIAGYVSFHGGLKTPEGQKYSVGTAPILIAHGGADASVSIDDVAALSRELEAAGVPYEIQVYAGARHGFTKWSAEPYQKRADEQSWDAFTDFLAEVLGS